MMLRVKIGIGVAVVGIGLAVATFTGTVAPRQQPSLPEQAVVANVTDGNSFDIQSENRVNRVRLMNIATPTSASPNLPAQCLGPEASSFLASLIPVGTTVHLTYANDELGRSVAAVTTQDGRLVNAEVARGGFAEVTMTGQEGIILSPVDAAAREAAANQRGLHSPQVGCTVPGQVNALRVMVARVPTAPLPGARAVDLNSAANAATDARSAADELVWAFQQARTDVAWRVLDPTERAQLEQQATAARDQVAAAEVALRNAASAALNQEASQNAGRAEDARVAKRLATIRAAESRRVQAARRAEAARRAQRAIEDLHRGRRSSSHSR